MSPAAPSVTRRSTADLTHRRKWRFKIRGWGRGPRQRQPLHLVDPLVQVVHLADLLAGHAFKRLFAGRLLCGRRLYVRMLRLAECVVVEQYLHLRRFARLDAPHEASSIAVRDENVTGELLDLLGGLVRHPFGPPSPGIAVAERTPDRPGANSMDSHGDYRT